MHEKATAKQQNRKAVMRVALEHPRLTACLADVGSTLQKAEITCLAPHKNDILRTMILAWQAEFDEVDLAAVSRAVELLSNKQL